VREQATDHLLSLVRQASEESKREIDLLINELTSLQKKLDDDRERIHNKLRNIRRSVSPRIN
jgi:hypothetical protein